MTGPVSAADWENAVEHAGIAYFMGGTPAKIERYDLDGRKWLNAISLPSARGELSTGTVDADGLYIAFKNTVYRYALDGTGEVQLVNTALPIQELYTDGNLLIVNYSTYAAGWFVSVDKRTNAVLKRSAIANERVVRGSVILRSANRLFGPLDRRGSSGLGTRNYTDNGDFPPSPASGPPFDELAVTTKAWAFPGEERVLDSAGQIYPASRPRLLGNLGIKVDGVQYFRGTAPVVLSGSTLHAFFPSLQPAGSYALSINPRQIFLDRQDVLAFTPDESAEHGIRLDVVPLGKIKSEPLLARNPNTLRFPPQQVFVGQDGLIYLYAEATQAIFRWNPATREYAGRIPLLGVPDFLTYSPENDAIYLAYHTGAVHKIQLTDPKLTETPLLKLNQVPPTGIAAAGGLLFAADSVPDTSNLPAAAKPAMNNAFITYTAGGQRLGSGVRHSFPRSFTWNGVSRRMYFLTEGLSPVDLHAVEVSIGGVLGEELDSPLHMSRGFVGPVRVSPDGKRVVLGSGEVHDGSTLERLATRLANGIMDAAWLPAALYTMREAEGAVQIQKWIGSSYALGAVKVLPGRAHTLLPLQEKLLLCVTLLDNGAPAFEILDADLTPVQPPTLAPPAGLALLGTGFSTVTLQWMDVSGDDGYVIQRKAIADPDWREIGTNSRDKVVFVDSAPLTGPAAYRVLARNGTLRSPFSTVLDLEFRPAPAPAILKAEAAGPREVNLTWSEVPGAARYLLERRQEGEEEFVSQGTFSNAAGVKTAHNLAPGTTYHFRLRAGDASGLSAPSPEVTAATLPGRPEDATNAGSNQLRGTTRDIPEPVILAAHQLTSTGVILAWTGGDNGLKFELEEKGGTSPEWVLTGAGRSNQYSLRRDDLQPDTQYSFRVRAVNIEGASEWSEVTFKTPAPPLAASAIIFSGLGFIGGGVVLVGAIIWLLLIFMARQNASGTAAAPAPVPVTIPPIVLETSPPPAAQPPPMPFPVPAPSRPPALLVAPVSAGHGEDPGRDQETASPALPSVPLPIPLPRPNAESSRLVGTSRKIMTDAQGRPVIELVETEAGQVMIQRQYGPAGHLLSEQATLNGQPVELPA